MKNFETQASGLIFPETQGSRIQMMPFLLTDEKTWTDDIKRYGDLVTECLNGFKIDGVLYDEFTTKPCFITIDERDVKTGETQRKPGVHTEGGYKVFDQSIHWGSGGWVHMTPERGGGIGEYKETHEKVRYGGLFLASNVDHSTALWNQNATHPGELGDVSHLDLRLEDAYLAQAGELIWLHDKTPHAALPVLQDVHRQFIRIVGPHVSHYFAGDNSENPHLNIREFYNDIQADSSWQSYQGYPNKFTFYPGTKQDFLVNQEEIARKHRIYGIEMHIHQYGQSLVSELKKHTQRVKILYEDKELSPLVSKHRDIYKANTVGCGKQLQDINTSIVSHLIRNKSTLEPYSSLSELLKILEIIIKFQNQLQDLK